MNKSTKFSPEVRERTVRMVQEHRDGYSSLWAAVESITPRIGCVPRRPPVLSSTASWSPIPTDKEIVTSRLISWPSAKEFGV